MMRYRWFAAAVLTVCSGALLSAAAGRRLSLELGTASWRPFAWEEQSDNIGIAVDVLDEVNRRTGLNLMAGVYPPVRLNTMLEEGRLCGNYADAPEWNTPEQLAGAVFSEPFIWIEEYIYFRKEVYRRVNRPQDLAGLTVGVVRGYYYRQYDALFSSGRIRTDYSGDEAGLLQKLIHSRVDCVFMDRAVYRYWSRRHNFPPGSFIRGARLSRVGVSIKLCRRFRYLLPMINRALREMRRDGTLQRIEREYAGG